MSLFQNFDNNSNVNIRVSSVLNKDVKQFGRKHLTDNQEDTCWNSDQGVPQWILIEFPARVTLDEVQIQFQGGFAGKECWLEGHRENSACLKKFQDIFPEDNNTLQIYSKQQS